MIDFRVVSNKDRLMYIIGLRTKAADSKAAKIVVTESRRIAPVLTGKLRSSIQYKTVDGDGSLDLASPKMGFAIGSIGLSYPKAVHDGLGGKRPQPFIRNAILTKQDFILRIYASMLGGA